LIELCSELLLERTFLDGSGLVIVPVPLHQARLRARGYNQAARLAAEAARTLGLHVADGLRRLVDTPPQVGRSGSERRATLQGAFAWRAGSPPPAALLLDDVLTTGATLLACARALRSAGCTEVQAMAIALG
jgi:predicted amidophosphoribosyltransferase